MDFRRSRKMSLDAQYAKWDSLEVEDDDDDEPRRPRVTKLEGPSRLTIGDGSCSATALPEPQDLSAVRHNYLGAAAAATKPAAARTPAAATKAAAPKRVDRLDYARWDKLEIDDNDDDDDDNEEYGDQYGDAFGDGALELSGDRGGSGAQHGSETPSQMELRSRSCSEQERIAEVADAAARARDTDALDPSEMQQLQELLARKPHLSAGLPTAGSSTSDSSATPEARAAQLREKLTRNGAARDTYLWRQSESEVEISILVPRGCRGSELRVKVEERAEHAAQHVALMRAGALLFEAQLAYPVEPAEDDDDLSWEVGHHPYPPPLPPTPPPHPIL
mgnify:FL=1